MTTSTTSLVAASRLCWRAEGSLRGWVAALAIATMWVVDVVITIRAGRVLYAGATLVTYPFELDFGEGPVLAAVRALLGGASPYVHTQAATLIANYPPVYYAAVAWLSSVAPIAPLAAGRGMALASALLAAVMLAALVGCAMRSTPRLLQLAAALFATAAFLQITYTAEWIALMRVDLLALALALAGVLTFVMTAGSGDVAWCALPLLLAVFTKQSSLAAAAACVVVLLRIDRRRALRLAGALALGTAAIAAVAQLVTGGGFWFNVVTANVHPYDWRQAVSFLQDAGARYPVFLAVAAVGVPHLWRALPAGVGPQRPATRAAITRAVLAAYLACAALTSLSVGKLGSDINHLIEVMAVVCAGVAAAAGDAVQEVLSAESQRVDWQHAVGALAIPLLLAAQVVWLAPGRIIEMIEPPGDTVQADVWRLVDRIHRLEGPVVSEDLVLLSLAEKPIVLQPFDGAQLAARGVADQQPIVTALAQGRVPLIVLRFDIAAPTRLAAMRFSPAVLEALRTHYQHDGRIAGYWLYVPRSPFRGIALDAPAGGMAR